MSTTKATLAGLQKIILADTVAKFRVASDLIHAVYTQSAGDSNTVQFSTSAVPAVVAAHTENGDITPGAVTIGAVAAPLAEYAALAKISGLTKVAPNAINKVSSDLAGQLARTVDTLIGALYAGFTESIGSTAADLDIDDFFTASTLLDKSGYVGQKVFVCDPITWNKMGAGLLAVATPNSKSEEYLSRGQVANVAGVDIFISPWITGATGNGMYFKEAIGFGYREPLIEVSLAENLVTNSLDVLAVSYFKAIEVTDGAGVLMIDKTVA